MTFAVYIILIILNISIGHNEKWLNVVKIYTNNAKYNSYNDSFIFKPTIFHDICSKANVILKKKIKTSSNMFKDLDLYYYYFYISICIILINFN